MGGEPARLFFALMPPPDVAEAIDHRRRVLALAGRPVAAARLHLTLLFLGRVEPIEGERWAGRAAALDAMGFDLYLDRLDHFARPRITCLGPSQAPQALKRLHGKLNKDTVGLAGGERFRPHVTLWRGASACAARAVPPIRWPVRHLSLLASGENGVPGGLPGNSALASGARCRWMIGRYEIMHRSATGLSIHAGRRLPA